MTRILITGGAGFVGSHLAERLVGEGDEVRVLDDLSGGSLANLSGLLDHPRFSFLRGSVVDARGLDEAAQGCRWILHLAAPVGVERAVREPAETWSSLVHGIETVLESAWRVGAGVLYTSSSEVYGRGVRTPFREEDDLVLGAPTALRWGYGAAKAMGEFLCGAYHRDRGVPMIVTRIFNTIGPRQSGRYGMVVPRFVAQAGEGKPVTVYGDGEQRRCFTDVRDTVEALVRLIRCREAIGSTFNVGSDREIRIAELAAAVVARCGERSEIVRVPYDRVYPPGFEDVRRRIPSLDRLERAVGFRPRRDLGESLDWILANRAGAGRVRMASVNATCRGLAVDSGPARTR